jgi:hypothetical protein
MTVDEAHALIRQITDTVNRQLEDRVRIYEEKILPALRRYIKCFSFIPGKNIGCGLTMAGISGSD